MRPAERSFSVTSEASRFAAAENISSVIRVAPLTSAPSPTPGKMYELLHCPGTNTCPRYETAGNGLPLAKIARPSVQAYARAERQDDLVAQVLAGDAQRREQTRERHRRGALDVVVEAAHPIAVALQDAEGVHVGEVLELDQDAREHLVGGGDELVDERVEL